MASDAAAGDQFGFSVSISGDTVLVGAWFDGDAGSLSGSAYIYQNDGPWTEVAKATASDAAPNDWLGRSVSISGDVALVGAPRDDDACSGDPNCNSGSAYVYRFSGTAWVEETKLTASDAAATDDFGGSVSIFGDTAVVGARKDDDPNNSGSAYVYRFNGTAWVEEAKLTASDATLADNFGSSVSISGDVVLVGAASDSDSGTQSGSAYVFRYDGAAWVEEAKLTASDAAAFDQFGTDVSINGDTALIGAFQDSDAGFSSGSAYVFRYDGTTWIEEAKLTASDTAPEDSFGESVSVSGDTALIGTRERDVFNTWVGSAYVFRYDGAAWVEEAKLTASDAAQQDSFGQSASVSGDTAVVGANGDDDGGSSSGSAYVFRYDGAAWVEEAKLTASDAATGDQFGFVVSISGGTILVGAFLDDDWGSASGSAYIFKRAVSLVTHTLSLTTAGTGSGSVGGAGIYDFGETAIVTAPADAGSTFTSWSGLDAAECATGSVAMTSDKSCTATFTLNTHTLSLATDGTGSGSVNGAGIYDFGETAIVTAPADAGSTFTSWSGLDAAECATGSVAMTSDKSCTATFTLDTHTLTLATDGTGSGSVGGAGIYGFGETAMSSCQEVCK